MKQAAGRFAALQNKMKVWAHRGGRQRQDGWSRIVRVVAALLILLLCGGILSGLLRARAAPAALRVCSIRTKGEVHALILKVSGEEIGGSYRDYCKAVYGEKGSVSSISVDTAAVNAVSARIAERLEGELNRFAVTAELPLGDLILPTLFSGRGRALKVHSTVYGAVEVEAKSSLSEAGINQTLHQLELEVRVSLSVVCMGREESLEVTALLPLAEGLVVGNTPGGLVISG